MKDLCYPFHKIARLTLGFDEWYGSIRHAGYDFGTADLSHNGNPNDDEISAMDDHGEVIGSALAKDGTGEYVIVYYKRLNVSVNYWHIVRRQVRIGQIVKRGQVLCYVGHSGKYAEHTHIGFKKGRRLGSLWESGYTINPQPYFDRMALWSNLSEDPAVIAELQAKIKVLDKQVIELSAQVTTLAQAVLDMGGSLKAETEERKKSDLRIVGLAAKVGYKVETFEKWDEQLVIIDQKIAHLPYGLSIPALIGIIINKITGKQNV